MGKCDETNVEVSMGDSASPMKPDNFSFTPPPEAPVFEPTAEEFLDPLAYINKIRPVAEKCGICKIKPPESWQPPFAVDVDRLRFTPRLQRLNELEAITRVKLNFLDQILKFWELQGSALRIPTVERKPLDLYALHKIVNEAGGFETCTSERKWSCIARRMGHPQGKGAGSILKGHYERILYPYDVFRALDDKGAVKSEVKSSVASGSPEGSRAAPEPTPEPKPEPPEMRRSPRENKWMSAGASCGSRSRQLREHRISNMTVSVTPARDGDPLAQYMCLVCGRGDAEPQLLLCDGCDEPYHTFCLLPPLPDVPKGEWRCVRCLQAAVTPVEAYGFRQAPAAYSLKEFGEMADQFKSDYFNMPVHMVPTRTVEKEFWRIVSSIDEDVTVEYGADLHSMDHGSGFPSAAALPGDKHYAGSPWNLNNLPVLPGSVLQHIHADISGMKVPWLYVGMCFATFCWHNEDHWSYSINYLHWGEPKTWYGVPGARAEQFEAAMQAAAPELFQLQPDLLHQLVTILSPALLQAARVPVFRTDQRAGEFVVTFPRAYHAGFNQGYNFAEAVNFAPADWLKLGRECIQHYSLLRRYCVFSHDELVCQMAVRAPLLTAAEALAAARDMRAMLHLERRARRALQAWGVRRAAREAFELLPDDERQCAVCRATLFLSAVTCACGKACPRHAQELCACPPAERALRYRYTLDELPRLLRRLSKRADAARAWAEEARAAIDPQTAKTRDLEGLRALRLRADELRVHRTELVAALEAAIEDADKCLRVIRQLDLHKMRTRHAARDTKYRLSPRELQLFADEVDALPCSLPEGAAVREAVRQVADFESRASAELARELAGEDGTRELEELVEAGARLPVRLPRLPALERRLAGARWLRRAQAPGLSPAELGALLARPPALPAAQPALARLARLHARALAWEERAGRALEPGAPLEPARRLLREGEALPAALPSLHALASALQHADSWLREVEEAQSKDAYPYVHTVEALLKRAAALPFAMPERDELVAVLDAANAWKEGAAKIFLKKKSGLSLMEALAPRTSAAPPRRRARPALAPAPLEPLLQTFQESAAPQDIVAAVREMEVREIEQMRQLRAENGRKDPRGGGSDVFCSCQKRQYGVMTQCQLCQDWFHARCAAEEAAGEAGEAGGESEEEGEAEGEAEGAAGEAGGGEGLCAGCRRTRRPALARLLALLVWLQRLRVRLPEGEALQCVTERALGWQDRARAWLAAPARAAPALLLEGDLLEVRLAEQAQVRAAAGRAPLRVDAGRLHQRRQPQGRKRRAHPQHRVRPAGVPASGVSGGAGRGSGRGAGRGSGRGAGRRGGRARSSSSEDEEDCAASPCRKPTGKEVDWVQCDGGCDQWFHMHCVGLSRHVLRPDDDYVCVACR